MRLLAYTIGGQTIGIDITSWTSATLSGNTAFIAFADTGGLPSNYVDISSTTNWDQFGGLTTLTDAEIKLEILKLIPNQPTSQEYLILENYFDVGLDSIINVDGNWQLSGELPFETLTGTTDISKEVDDRVFRSGDTMTGNLTVNAELRVTGTTATQQQLQEAVLLGAVTSDGQIISTNTPALNVSEEVTDINTSTGITEVSGIYYVDTTSGDVTLTIPNADANNDASRMSIIKKGGDNNVIITTVGGTQNIGNQTIQTISQTDKGLTIVADNDNNKWIVVQDSRYVEGETEGELQYWDNTLKVWKPTSSDITWNNDEKIFTVGGNSTPPTMVVDSTNDIVYLNAQPLTGLTSNDDLALYAAGRYAYGNSITIDR